MQPYVIIGGNDCSWNFPPPSIWMFYWIASRSWEFKKPANWREYQTIQDLWEFVPCMLCYNRAEKEKFMSTGNIVYYSAHKALVVGWSFLFWWLISKSYWDGHASNFWSSCGDISVYLTGDYFQCLRRVLINDVRSFQHFLLNCSVY